MGEKEWKRRGFADPDVTHIYTENKDVQEQNYQQLEELKSPICKIAAKHNGLGITENKGQRIPTTSF